MRLTHRVLFAAALIVPALLLGTDASAARHRHHRHHAVHASAHGKHHVRHAAAHGRHHAYAGRRALVQAGS